MRSDRCPGERLLPPSEAIRRATREPTAPRTSAAPPQGDSLDHKNRRIIPPPSVGRGFARCVRAAMPRHSAGRTCGRGDEEASLRSAWMRARLYFAGKGRTETSLRNRQKPACAARVALPSIGARDTVGEANRGDFGAKSMATPTQGGERRPTERPPTDRNPPWQGRCVFLPHSRLPICCNTTSSWLSAGLRSYAAARTAAVTHPHRASPRASTPCPPSPIRAYVAQPSSREPTETRREREGVPPVSRRSFSRTSNLTRFFAPLGLGIHARPLLR